MHCKTATRLLLAALILATPGAASATTREIADLQPVRLSFEQSTLNQLTYGTYRDPFDELQTRPYNLLYANIGRYSNLSPWEGQAGNYTRYLNALIGNNGVANVDNDADAMQGSMIRRVTAGFAWGVSASYLSGTDGSGDTSQGATFANTDDLTGFDLRLAAARQVSERRVLGAGLRLTSAKSEITDGSFEQGVGGFFGSDTFDQTRLTLDFGFRQFQSSSKSWEFQGIVGVTSSNKDNFSEDLDVTGAVTERFVITNYDISDVDVAFHASMNRQRPGKLGETQYRAGLERTHRDLDDPAISFSESAGTPTPNLTLLNQDTIATTRLFVAATTVFQAGETEMFAGADLGLGMVEGSTRVLAGATPVSETIDDSDVDLGLTLGLRQSLLGDKLRVIVSGRADLHSEERNTVFDASRNGDDATLSSARYAVGLEGVLANVTFDIAWLSGEEAPVVPVQLGLPGGSRRTVVLDRLVFSAAVAW